MRPHAFRHCPIAITDGRAHAIAEASKTALVSPIFLCGRELEAGPIRKNRNRAIKRAKAR